MAFDKFIIGPITEGLRTDIKPFLIPDNAFSLMRNCYTFRGRVRKRFGSHPMSLLELGSIRDTLRSRLAIKSPANLSALGDITIVAPPPPPIFFPIPTTIGQSFAAIDLTPNAAYEIFTINALGAPAQLLTNGPSIVHTLNTTTGALQINGSIPNAAFFFYPNLPVMGIFTFEQGKGDANLLIAFDTRYVYSWSDAGFYWDRLGVHGVIVPALPAPVPPPAIPADFTIWSGEDDNYFSATTFTETNSTRVFVVVNFNIPDRIRFYNPVLNTWNLLNAVTEDGVGYEILTSLLTITFKGRLLFLNTIENVNGVETRFFNRVRFSNFGFAFNDGNFNEDVSNGGFADADTSEAITGVEFLNDRLIITFESSYYELVFTNNESSPFIFQKLNSELGNESTFSMIPFDKMILNVGPQGIQACTGAGVERIDENIPDTVFLARDLDNDGVRRIYGVRDYFSELAYWTWPSDIAVSDYPTRLLVYNYMTKSWAFFDDKITVFGYFNKPIFKDASNQNARGRERVIYGTLQGFINIIDRDLPINAITIQITDIDVISSPPNVILTTMLSNLQIDDFIYIKNVDGINNINNKIYKITNTALNTVTIVEPLANGVYSGGGFISLVSEIEMLTKQFNFYADQARNAYIQRVDFLVDRTFSGEIFVDSYISSSQQSMVEQGELTGCIISNGILETSAYPSIPFEFLQDRVCHPMYMQSDGEYVQFHIYLTDEQMLDTDIYDQDLQIHIMTIWTMPTTYGMR